LASAHATAQDLARLVRVREPYVLSGLAASITAQVNASGRQVQ
jgi:hypothetical protein